MCVDEKKPAELSEVEEISIACPRRFGQTHEVEIFVVSERVKIGDESRVLFVMPRPLAVAAHRKFYLTSILFLNIFNNLKK